jgi:hypothetical protein
MSQKKKVFSKVKAIKDMARVNVGQPKGSQTIPDAKSKAAQRKGKHKPSLGDLLAEE